MKTLNDTYAVKNNSAIKSERDKFLFLMFQGNNGYTEILTIS